MGPSDLRLAIGGTTTRDHDVDDRFDAAIQRVLAAARAAGVVAGVHTPDGAAAALRIAQGFTVVTVASDVVHLEAAAREHLDRARRGTDDHPGGRVLPFRGVGRPSDGSRP
ncbi:hypothetical protein GCM10025864_19560 [Luteimicrobium album]|uniref:HpcH/HpaI aldolase/citrate lyase domain-containing protein n=1 Tax=Luteimicrobium album TaxID=1054550 RepID=A0ABQ6I1U1_9MICO|nr:aldolase/citrate lyase family protein [Luteimicrobium album]GMA24197.1 hypothetical protein GCM10025864_19560 [Luteimicrobium album]